MRRKAREERSGSLELPFAHAWCEDVDGAALKSVVRQAIGRLPSTQRQVVELAYWEGRTHKDVAETLGLPEGTVKSRLRLAQAKLTEWLAPVRVESQ
jgi:RNA polymerase sigma-70 factor (ECF subfamily)